MTAWLAANAPASFAALRPPASPADLDACERAAGVALPEDLRRLLLVNNGAAEINHPGVGFLSSHFMPGGHRLLPAAEIAGASAMLDEIVADLDADMTGQWWHPRWVLFAVFGNGDGLVIDQRPGPRQGVIGDFYHEQGAVFGTVPSLGAFVAEMADALEHGAEMLRCRPAVVDGALQWAVGAAD